jgi:hypothetical protein
MDITGIIKKNRPHLSSSSVRTYESILKNLAKKIQSKPLDRAEIIANVDKITAELKDKSPKNRKTIYSALIVILDDGNDNNQVLNKFRTQMMRDSETAEQDDSKQMMNDKQRDNWMDWPDVLTLYKNLEKKVKPLFKIQNPSSSMIRLMQQYVMLSLFTLIKPRRTTDWISFKLRDIDKAKDNYLQGNTLIFNDYKTKKYLGVQKVECPRELKKILNDWSKVNDKPYLLMDTKGNQMNASKFTQELYNIFDKKISTNMLRHSYLTNLLKDVPKLKELQQNMKDMGQTNLLTQLQYVKK